MRQIPSIAPLITALFGATLELEGRLVEAAEAYEEAARLDPEGAQLQRHLAHIWVEKHRWAPSAR